MNDNEANNAGDEKGGQEGTVGDKSGDNGGEEHLFAGNSFSRLELNEQTSERYSGIMKPPESTTDDTSIANGQNQDKNAENMTNGGIESERNSTPTVPMSRKISQPPPPSQPSLRAVTSQQISSAQEQQLSTETSSSTPQTGNENASNAGDGSVVSGPSEKIQALAGGNEKAGLAVPQAVRPGAVSSKPGAASISRPPPVYGQLLGKTYSSMSDHSGSASATGSSLGGPTMKISLAPGEASESESKMQEKDDTLDNDGDKKPSVAEIQSKDAPLTLLEIDNDGAGGGTIGGSKIDDPDAAIKADAAPPSMHTKPGAYAVVLSPGSTGKGKQESVGAGLGGGGGGLTMAAVAEDYDNSAENTGDALTLSQIKEMNRPPASAVAARPGAMEVRSDSDAPKKMADNSEYVGVSELTLNASTTMDGKSAMLPTKSEELRLPTAMPLNAETVAPVEAYSVDDISTITGGSADQQMTSTERDLARRLQKLEEERSKVVQAQEVIVETEPMDGHKIDSIEGGGTTGSNSTPGIANGADKSSSSDRICGLSQTYGIAGCIVLSIVIIAVAVIVGIVVVGGNGEEGSSGDGGINRGNFGGDFARFQQFQNVLRNVSDTSKMTDPTSPEFLALKWLTTDDPLQLSPNNITERSSVIERFCLAALYYSTGGTDEGDGAIDSETSPPAPTTTWLDDSGWLTGELVCEWNGVSCTNVAMNDRVFGLELSGNNLIGSLPIELGALTHLESISLGSNSLTDTIPSELGRLTALRQLDLFDNSLSGTIPVQVFTELTNIEFLSLENNKFSGPISSEIRNLKALQRLYLSGNGFNSTIPVQLGECTRMIDLFLDKNNLSGSIPSDLGKLQNIVALRLNGNDLSQSIPTMLGELAQLRELTLSDNNLSGGIPTEFGNLEQLIKLQLFSNSLTGPIPSQLGGLPLLIDVELFDNELNNTIPTELSQLEALETLFLDENELTGSIPSGLGNILELKALSLYNNALTGDIPAELGQLGGISILFLYGNELSGDLNELFCDFNTNFETIRGDYVFLQQLEADCDGENPKVSCGCCHRCF